MNFLVVTAASIAVLVVMHGITFAVGRRIGRYNVVDVTWGLGFVGVGGRRRGVRLGRSRSAGSCCWCWWRCGGCGWPGTWSAKSAGKGEDPRYVALMRGDFSAGRVLRKIFLIQAAATWFVSLPLQVSAVLGPTPSVLLPVLIAGVAIWAVGAVLRGGRRPPVAAVQGRPRQQGSGDGPRPVGMDTAPQLFRRRLRVVGAVAGVHRGLDFTGDGAVAGAHDLFPGVRHRRAAGGEAHEGSAGIP